MVLVCIDDIYVVFIECLPLPQVRSYRSGGPGSSSDVRCIFISLLEKGLSRTILVAASL